MGDITPACLHSQLSIASADMMDAQHQLILTYRRQLRYLIDVASINMTYDQKTDFTLLLLDAERDQGAVLDAWKKLKETVGDAEEHYTAYTANDG